MKVFIYRNLHKPGCFSIQAREGKRKMRVIGHARSAVVHDATFPVSEKTRQKVISTRRRRIHAGVLGQLEYFLTEKKLPRPRGYRRATYNPFKYRTFVDVGTGQPVYRARDVILIDPDVYYR